MTTTTTPEEKTEDKIREGYLTYVLEHDEAPGSAYKLCKFIDLPEEEFYQHYTTVDAIENDVWKGFFEATVTRIEQDEVYGSYTVREKLLAFYFTWIEELKAKRSFILTVYNAKKHRGLRPQDFKVFKEFKQAFQEYCHMLVNEGLESGEIVERPYVTTQYAKALWVQALTILKFWIKDTSKGFEKTDTFIEKSANLGFDMMGHTPLDSALDFMKFAFQSRMK
jgi:AcrR family transcriptional regulator